MTGGGHQRLRTSTALLAAAALLAALYLASSWRDERRLDRANAAGRAGDYATAIAEARRVSHAPTLARALRTEAFAQLDRGDLRDADAAFRRAADAAPNDPTIRRAWADTLFRLHRPADARRQLARAVTLDPGSVLPPGYIR